jgi:hypothetical protein
MLDKVPSFTIYSNAETLPGVLDAAHSTVEVELKRLGFETIEPFTVKELLKFFTYKNFRVRRDWYRHVFTNRSAVSSSRS